jgi:ABC-2 type transport system ATP-binding protein
MPPAIDADRLSHRYLDRDALVAVSFTVEPGETFALLGPNGGGKTTLFRILATLLVPSGGTVRVFGHDVRTQAAAVRRALGVVFQSPAIDQQLTVAENLVCHGHLYGLRGAHLDRRMHEVLEGVGLVDRASARTGTLSGGQQRRVELAKALLPEPRALVLDEASTGLDPRARRDLWAQLAALRGRRGTTIVLTTHLMDEAAVCDRVGIIDAGRLVGVGRPADLTAAVGGDVVWIAAADAEALAPRVRDRFGGPVAVVGGRLRLERPRGHEFVPAVIEAFPGEIDGISVSRPTLDDAFVHHTGHLLT